MKSFIRYIYNVVSNIFKFICILTCVFYLCHHLQWISNSNWFNICMKGFLMLTSKIGLFIEVLMIVCYGHTLLVWHNCHQRGFTQQLVGADDPQSDTSQSSEIPTVNVEEVLWELEGSRMPQERSPQNQVHRARRDWSVVNHVACVVYTRSSAYVLWVSCLVLLWYF